MVSSKGKKDAGREGPPDGRKAIFETNDHVTVKKSNCPCKVVKFLGWFEVEGDYMYLLEEPNGTQSPERETKLSAGHPPNVQWDPPHKANFKTGERVYLKCTVTNGGKWNIWKKCYPFHVRVEGSGDTGVDLIVEEKDLKKR